MTAEPEYIITEEQLLEIGGFADYRDDSSYREMRELQNEIRSRPHSSAKESSDKVLDDFDLINILKKRYRKEMSVIDVLENVEDEILALRTKERERMRKEMTR